ncbi:MAG: hypothetical protein Q9227_008351 [Pyrenula ochraceoflavens]
MAPGVVVNGTDSHTVNGIDNTPESNGTHPNRGRRLCVYDEVQFDHKLKPKAYHMEGTRPDSKVLFLDVNILDSTSAEPYRGDVLIEGERFSYVGSVPDVERLKSDPKVRVIQGRNRTLMPGLGDAHTHFTWNEGDLGALGGLGVEEHTLVTVRAAQKYLDSGYTMCFGAASAKERLDVVIRDAINRGDIPGPRYLANGKEMARRDGELVGGITAFADGPLEMREVIRHHIDLGVDQIKLSMSGEEICETRSAEDCYFTDEETAACVDEAHRQGKRLCAHARARDSVKMCIKHGVDVIYHASWTDAEGMDMLEANKSKHMVAPGINWLYCTLYEAEPFGYSFSKAEKVGYKREFENAKKVLKEMHQRGITVLPGGDYGFAWTPHGTYARDLEHFVKLLDFTPMESILAATAGIAKLFMREDELGKILPGFLADCILVDGNPLDDIAILQDHDKLNVIMINGRIHKASYTEFVKLESDVNPPPLTNYLTYKDSHGRTRIGHLNLEDSMITPLAMKSGAPLTSFAEVIELGNDTIPCGEAVSLDTVTILPPLDNRDILCVGKNYSEHAKEFNNSGYDSSDKVDLPSQPVIFTKRSTSIIASGQEILPHPDFTSTLDYEGEIGVIIGKSGFRISESQAMDYIWGYCILNDVTARERQRDHKQFYIGKSADTFCPMGPIAVPASSLPKMLRVQTFVNGQKRQDGTTDDLIFSIPGLVKTLSEGTTLQAGDVIATGTPAGVGFGLDPPTFLKPGDVVEISVTGLGTLRNRVSQGMPDAIAKQSAISSAIPTYNLEPSCGGSGLLSIGSKSLYVEEIGSETIPVVFVHGLGGTSEFFRPLIQQLGLDRSYRCILSDLEGHGASPTKASSVISIHSYANDLLGIFNQKSINSGTIVVAHSMGCLVALSFAIRYPHLVSKLILLGPPPSPLPATAAEAQRQRAAAVRQGGMRASGVVEAVATAGTSIMTRTERTVAFSAVRASLSSQNPEGYAKGCTALAGTSGSQGIELEKLQCPTMLVTGEEDKVCPPSLVEKMKSRIEKSSSKVLGGVGHWHAIEDVDSVAGALRDFL